MNEYDLLLREVGKMQYDTRRRFDVLMDLIRSIRDTEKIKEFNASIPEQEVTVENCNCGE